MPQKGRDVTNHESSGIGGRREQLLAGKPNCEDSIAEELSNIKVYGPKHNAFVTVFSGTRGLALSRAREIDARLERGGHGKQPPLLGVPVTIKDNTFFAGFPTTNGSDWFSDFVPSSNAQIVDQLLAAGCVPLGKTNMHELALGVTGTSGRGGPIRNAVDASRISGGSSGGSAVSVALSKVPLLSIGSDTGGSVRIPAALCGVCGFKPSQGLLSTDGVFPLSPSLDHLGLFTKTMPDMSLVFGTLTGKGRVTKGSPRLGVPTRYFTEDMDEKVSKDFHATLDSLRKSGEFAVSDVPTEESYARYTRARAVITLSEGSWFYEELLSSSETRKTMHQDVLALMDSGRKMGRIEYMHSMGLRADSIRMVVKLLDGVDALIMPTCLIVAPRIDEVLGKETGRIRFLMLRNTELFNLSGLPAISIPMSGAGELPTSLQIVGRHGQDALVVSIAEKIWSTLDAGRAIDRNT